MKIRLVFRRLNGSYARTTRAGYPDVLDSEWLLTKAYLMAGSTFYCTMRAV